VVGVVTSKLTDKTLGEAAQNPDGTYNGVAALRWLAEALSGTSISEAEGQELLRKAQEKARAKLEAERNP
jgi:hypothetical protein